MKTFSKIFGLSISIAIVFSILFQSHHSYEHFLVQLSEKKCYHKSESTSEITHQHTGFEKCFACEFHFSQAYFLQKESIVIQNNFDFKPENSFSVMEVNAFYRGISYSLRGPPIS